MRNPFAKRPTALVLTLSLIGYMIALIGPALAVGAANAANGKVIKSWNEIGTVITEDINLSDSDLPEDAAGRTLRVGKNVTVTGATSKTFKGLSFLITEGHTLTLNNLNIDNSVHPELAMVTVGDNNGNNRLAFTGENNFTRQDASSENASKDYTVPLPLVQVKADTTLNIGQSGSGTLNLSNPKSPRSQAALIGTQHFSAFGTINIAGGSLNLQGSSQSAAMIGSGGAFYEVNPETNPSWLNNYDETPWSAGGTINVKGGTINLSKVGSGTYGGAFIGSGRGAVQLPDSAGVEWAQKNAAVNINVSGGQINAHGNHTALGAGSFTTPLQDSQGQVTATFTQPYARVKISGGTVQVSPDASDTGNSAMNIGCRGVGNWNQNFANHSLPLAPGCEVAISGGKVTVGTADSTLDKTGDIAAIGSGPDSANLDVKIPGSAQVTAYSNGRGAAIGGGYASGTTKVTISDNAQVNALGVVRESPAIGAGGLPGQAEFAGNSRLDEDAVRGADQNQVIISGNAQVNAETAKDSAVIEQPLNGAIGSAANRSGQVSITDHAAVTAKVYGVRRGAVIGSAGWIDSYVSDPFKVTISGSPKVQAVVQPVSQSGAKKLAYGLGAAIGSGFQTKVPAQITLSGSPNLDLIGGQASSGVGLGFKSSGGGSSVTANLDADAKIQATSPVGTPRTDGSAVRSGFPLAKGQNMPLDTTTGKGQVLNLRFADGSGNPQTLGLTTAVDKLTQDKQSVPFSLVTPEGETVHSSALTSTLYNNLALSVPKTGNYYLQSKVTPSLFAYHGDKDAEDAFIFPVNGQIYTQDGLLWAPGYSLKYQVAGAGGTLPPAYTTTRYLPPNTVIGALPAVTLPTVTGKTCAVDYWELNDAQTSEEEMAQTKISANTVVKAVTKCEDTVTPPEPQPEKVSFTWQLQDSKGQALSGGQFTLTEKGGAAVSVPDSSSGTFTVSDLNPAKSYVLTQTAAPSGYDLPQQRTHTVTFEKISQEYQAKVDDQAISGEAFVITNTKTPLPPQPVRESPAIGAGGLPGQAEFAGNSRLDEDAVRGADQNQVIISGNAQVNAETAKDSAVIEQPLNGAIGSAANRSGQVSITDHAAVTAKVYGVRRGAVIGSAGWIDSYVSDPFKVTISGSPKVQAVVQPVSQSGAKKLAYGLGAAIGSGFQTKVPAQITLSGSPNLDLIGGQASSGVGLGFKSSGGGSSVTANLDADAKIQATSPVGTPRTDGSAVRSGFPLAKGQNMPLDTTTGKGQVLNLRFADGSGNPQTLGLTTAVDKLTQDKQSVPFSLVTPEGETVHSSALTSTLYNNLALSVPKTGNYYLQSKVTPSLFAYHGDKDAEDAFIFPVNGQIYTQDGLLWAPGYSLKYQVAGAGGTLPPAYTTTRYLPPNTVIGALPAVTLPTVTGKTCAVDYWELNDAQTSEEEMAQTKISANTVVKAVTKCEDTVTPPEPQPEKVSFTWQLQDSKGQALSGGQFTLTEKGGAAVSVPDSSSGTFTVSDLNPAKSYVLTQTAAPSGYDLPQQRTHTVTFEKISQEYQAKVDDQAISGEAFVITNTKTPLPPQPVAFNWKLQDADKNLLPGGSFKLVCGSEEVAVPAAGTASGSYSVSLDPTKGGCTLTQTAAPEGYKLGDATSYQISFVEKDHASGIWAAVVAGKETSEVTFTNVALPKPPATTSFAWKLTDTAGKSLNGAVFTLSGGETPLTVTSQDAADPGTYSASNLDPKKTYTLTETTAPSGYKADTPSYQLTFVADGASYRPQIGGKDLPDTGLVIKNVKLPTPAEIRWEVVSSADATQYVPGTSFKITPFKADGTTLDAAKAFTVSDATTAVSLDLNKGEGQYRVVVPDGSRKYQVEQLTTSPDFAPKTGAQVVTFTKQADGRYLQNVEGSGLKFENTPVMRTAQFTWKLVDKDSKKPLSGGSFSLTNGSEKISISENAADASFQATLNQAKTYKLQQTEAPEGYEKYTKTYTISYEDGKVQVSTDDTGVDLTDGALVISNAKKATESTTNPTTDPSTEPTTPGTEPTTEPTDNPTQPVSGKLTWKVVDGTGQPVGGTSFQITPLGTDGKPNTAAAFKVTDSVSGPTTFAVRTDLDDAVGAYKVKVDDVTLQYHLEQLTTAKGMKLAAPQTLSFSKGTDGKWSQNAAAPFFNPAAPEEPPTTEPTTPSTEPTTEPNPGDNGEAGTNQSGSHAGGATEAPAGAYMTGGSSAGSSSAAGPTPSSLRVTGANGATLALISAILALAGAGLLAARKLLQDR